MPGNTISVLDRPLPRYATAVLVIIAAILLRQLLVQGIGLDLSPFITSYPAVLVVALLAGLGPGLLATLLAGLAEGYHVLPSPSRLSIPGKSEFVALAIFVAVGICMSLVAERYRRSLQAIAAYRAEKAVRLTEAKLEAAMASMADAVFISDAHGRYIQFNDAFVTFHNLRNKAECPATIDAFQKLVELSTLDGQVVPPEMWSTPRALRGETASNVEYRVRRRDTGESWFGSFSFNPLRDDQGAIIGAVVVARDITERTRAENHIRRLNRVYAVLSDINETIVRESDTQVMLDAACRIAVEKGEFRMAWIGMVNPETQILEPIASSGVIDGYLDHIHIDFRHPDRDAGPAARCFHSGQHALCNDIERDLRRPWKHEALRRGYRSAASFPLRRKDKVIGIFTLYATEPAFFNADETKLFDEMAMDISFALEVNRHEQQRRQAEKHVQHLNRVYAVLSGINETIVRESDSQAMLQAACRIAVEKGEFLMAWIGTVNPDTQLLEPVASSGVIDGYLDKVHIDFRHPDRTAGPAARCFHTGLHAICNDIEHELHRPWKSDALRLGYRSSASFPLLSKGKPIGVFTLYAGELAFFDEEETMLLDEMAMDISFALEVNLHEQERRKVEEELRWRTAFFEAQIDSSLDGVLVVDNHGKVILQNQRMRDMFQIPPEIASDPDDARQLRSVLDRIKNPESFLEKIQHLYAHPDQISRDEIELLDGTIIDRFSAPVRDKSGHDFGRIWTFRDVTQARQLEEQFRQAQKMESIGQLTGGIAHDFNNLLTVIQGCSEFLAEEIQHNPRLNKMANMVLDAAHRGTALTHRMLAFARRQALQPCPVDVNDLLAGMETLLRRTLSEEIDLEIVPNPGEPMALVDPSQLESALLNLCLNARDAMPGGGKLTIESSMVTLDAAYAELNLDVTPGPYILVAVSDTGCGITPENLARVFDPFFTTKEVGKGTGLGLSMVYGFVKQSRGHVKIYSEPGCGSSVKIYLPVAGQETESSRPEPVPTGDLHGSETILLAEDDPSVRSFAVTALADLGYRVLQAANGKDALQLLRRHPEADLLFTDVVMPGGLNGHELAVQACALSPKLRVLYCSGYAEHAVLHQGLQNHEIHLLNKPYSRLELARKIRCVLQDAAPPPEKE